jgi:signal recognition particle subunit SRP68
MAHANSILDSESGKAESKETVSHSDKMLLDRLDTYYEDPELVKGTAVIVFADVFHPTSAFLLGKSKLAAFPPSFEALPCKPLFFDLAREQLDFPSLEDRVGSPAKGGASAASQGASGGWLGGWLGGWKK